MELDGIVSYDWFIEELQNEIFCDITDAQYDQIFYLIGEYDFDVANDVHRQTVANLIVSKVTEYKGVCRHVVAELETAKAYLYKYCRGGIPHPTVASFVEKRERAERLAEQNFSRYSPRDKVLSQLLEAISLHSSEQDKRLRQTELELEELRSALEFQEDELAKKRALFAEVEQRFSLERAALKESFAPPRLLENSEPALEHPKVWEPIPYQLSNNKYVCGTLNFEPGYVDYSYFKKEQIMTEIQNLDDETYNLIFYLIGGYDFDPTKPEVVENVYDLCLIKATEKAKCRYQPCATSEYLYRGLYKYDPTTEPHNVIRHRVEWREKQERYALSEGRIYVPHSEKATAFRVLLGELFGLPTANAVMAGEMALEKDNLVWKIIITVFTTLGVICILLALCGDKVDALPIAVLSLILFSPLALEIGSRIEINLMNK